MAPELVETKGKGPSKVVLYGLMSSDRTLLNKLYIHMKRGGRNRRVRNGNLCK